MIKFDIYKDETYYLAWPTLIKLKNDELFCMFTSCNHHHDRDNSCLKFTKSGDRGRTWSTPEAFTETSDHTSFFNNARIRRLGDIIVVVCDKLYEGKPAEVFLWFSDDEAKTFSGPFKTGINGMVPDIKQLHNGNWLLTAQQRDGENNLGEFAYISTDRGKTWSDKIVVGKAPEYELCESCVLECSDDTLVAFMRENSFKGYDCIKAISHDGGYTWGELHSLAVPSCHRPTVGFLQNGKILLTYRHMGGPCALPQFITCAALFDENAAKDTRRQHQNVRIMPLDYDRHPMQDCGYTDWVQFDDGEIYIVNYIKDNWDKGQIRGYSLYYNDIVLE